MSKRRGHACVSGVAGRMENVIVAMHSIAGAFCGSLPMQRCGGAVMMGAALDGTVCGTMTAATAPRPLLHIFGQLDGQLRLPRAAWAAAAAAHMATQLGARCGRPGAGGVHGWAGVQSAVTFACSRASTCRSSPAPCCWALASACRTFALQRPFAVVPGLNHASMSNGECISSRSRRTPAQHQSRRRVECRLGSLPLQAG
jgi:hypothetical protein